MTAENKSYCNESNHLSATLRLFNLIRSGEYENIQVLLQEGVDIEVKNSQGFTPALLAIKLGRKNVVELLVEKGANVDCRENSTKATMLHHVTRHGTEWLSIVKAILERKPDLEATDRVGLTALHYAAYFGNAETVRCLVKAGAEMNARNNKAGCTPMLIAADRRHREVVRLLLNEGARFDIRNIHLRTVWHYAALNGWLDVVQFLSETISAKRISNLDVKDTSGQTALHHAAYSGNVETVRCLVEAGADINAENKARSSTPMMIAAERRHQEVVRLLLNKGARFDACNIHLRTVWHYAALNGWLDVAQLLAERISAKRISNLEIKDTSGQTALHLAAYSGNAETVKCLVKAGADINAENKAKSTPVLIAAESRHREVVRLLLNKGARCDVCNNYSRTVWHYAALNGWSDVVQFLSERISDIECRDSLGMTALHIAAYSGNVETVRCLVEAGADINSRHKANSTPMLIAAERRHREVVQLLLDKGARFDIYNSHLRTVWHYAALNGWLEMVKFLEKKIRDLEVKDKNDHTALHLASKFRQLEIVKFLVEELKVDINARNCDGNTPLLTACQLSYLDIVEYLFKKNARCDVVNNYNRSPLFHLFVMQRPDIELIKLFIERTPHLLSGEYLALRNNSRLQVGILQDVDICCQIIVNKYNNRDLPELNKLLVAGSLPRIERIRIVCKTETHRAIERAVRFEIQTKGHCTPIKVHPMVLKAICVESILKYYKKNMQIWV